MDAPGPGARTPLYPLAYAAALAGLEAGSARAWTGGQADAFRGDGTGDAAELALTFEDLLALRLVRGLHETGLGLAGIHRAARAALDRFGGATPFVTRRFRAEGHAVFAGLRNQRQGRDADWLWLNALAGRQEFRDVVDRALFDHLTFAGELPCRWFPHGRARGVAIEPGLLSGAPHIVGTRVRTDVVADAVADEGGGARVHGQVAQRFGITERQVRDAVAAEAAWRCGDGA